MAFCTNCGFQIDEASFCGKCGTSIQSIISQSNNDIPATSISSVNMDITKSCKEYKVLTQKDKWFSGKFDPALLEQALNAYAQQGWRFMSCATADVAGFGATRQEFVAILERDI